MTLRHIVLSLIPSGSTMQTITPSPSVIQTAISVLRRGGIIAHPTETCYGFAASLFSEQGIDRLYALKKMSRAKPLSIFVSSFDEAKRYGVFSEKALALAREFWPGPLTILVPRTPALPSYFNPGTSTIGMRISPHPVVKTLLATLGALVTTSANISGEKEPYCISNIGLSSDFIIDTGELPRVSPSTIVDGETLKVLRHGAISEKELYEFSHRFDASSHKEPCAEDA